MTQLLPQSRRHFRAAVLIGIVAAALLFFAADVPARLGSIGASEATAGSMEEGRAMDGLISQTKAAPMSAALASMLDSGQWLNTPTLRADDVRGKVVLVNFWTFSCINSLRPLPYLKAWTEKYRKRGLIVIGVHSPEFEFEKDIGNVQRATGTLGIGFPVRLDSDSTVWRKFGNRAWPGFYFIDANGQLRHQSFGEGNYAETERLIQKLLNEADGKSATGSTQAVSAAGVQAAPNWANLRTPETYVGYARSENFASPGGIREDLPSLYHASSKLLRNHWSLSGKWTVGQEFAALTNDVGSISYRFHARDLHLVLGTDAPSQPIAFRITIDGEAPGAGHGADVDENGWGTVREERLYQLVRQKGAVTDRTFKIEFLAPGVRAYAFTFG